MIRGALILGTGFAVGYKIGVNREPSPEIVKANAELKDATTELIRTMRAVIVDAWLDAKTETAEAKAKAEAENDIDTQGETPQ